MSNKRHFGAALCIAACLGATATQALERPAQVAQGVFTLRTAARGAGDDRVRPARCAFIVGPRGVIVVDSGLSHADGRAILESIARTTRAPVRLLVLTHPSQEAIFGAAAFEERGIPVAMHADAAALMAGRCDACLGRLRATLGEAAMEGTRVVAPTRILHDGDVLRDTGRALSVVAPGWSSAPGAIALFDAQTSTVMAGSIVPVRTVPDLRDANIEGWHAALARIGATRCRHLVPAYGMPGTCADAASLARYLDELQARVRSLRDSGVELADLDARAALPSYAHWDRYGSLHGANANRTYLRLEREALARP